jgi:16S rRNA (cytidine1402-2'-O)-methyltransferase
VAEGVLYVVATPIGNLEDITRRAERVLREADRVLAEDTRRTRALLSHLGIEKKPLERLDAHASEADLANAVARLQAGDSIALVSDAGTPVVSDPGKALVRAAAAAGIRIVPVPGPSAVLSALSVSGMGEEGFTFVGFLPRAGKERDDALLAVIGSALPVVMFESPHRVEETLSELSRLAPSREVVIARELTKLHEEILRGTSAELAQHRREWLGEITLVLGPKPRESEVVLDSDVDAAIDAELARGSSAKDAAQIVAARTGRPRREIYARILSRKSLARE